MKRHQSTFVLAHPIMRDSKNNRVVSWGVLQTTSKVSKLKELLQYYATEGFEGVVPIPCFEEDDPRAIEFPPDLCAAFFREYLGINGR